MADVEILWSVAKNIVIDNRNSMTRVLLEALLFLKVNNGYWNLQTVCKAMEKARCDKVKARVQEDNEQQSAYRLKSNV